MHYELEDGKWLLGRNATRLVELLSLESAKAQTYKTSP